LAQILGYIYYDKKRVDMMKKKVERGGWCFLFIPLILLSDIPLKKSKVPVPLNPFYSSTQGEPLEICEEALELLGGKLPLREGNSFIKLGESGVACCWVLWGISGTRIDWRARKPGVYASSALAALIMSNCDVFIDFENFGDLYNPLSVDPYIETFYGFTRLCSNQGIDDVNWIPAEELNYHDVLIEDGCFWIRAWRLWNKIIVGNQNTAGEYENEATITLTLINVGLWLESSLGGYDTPEKVSTSSKILH
jgi:hypothetical protein